jgi:hypothetical protein
MIITKTNKQINKQTNKQTKKQTKQNQKIKKTKPKLIDYITLWYLSHQK